MGNSIFKLKRKRKIEISKQNIIPLYFLHTVIDLLKKKDLNAEDIANINLFLASIPYASNYYYYEHNKEINTKSLNLFTRSVTPINVHLIVTNYDYNCCLCLSDNQLAFFHNLMAHVNLNLNNYKLPDVLNLNTPYINEYVVE